MPINAEFIQLLSKIDRIKCKRNRSRHLFFDNWEIQSKRDTNWNFSGIVFKDTKKDINLSKETSKGGKNQWDFYKKNEVQNLKPQSINFFYWFELNSDIYHKNLTDFIYQLV